ncbi:Holliday junction resolvase RuvX [Acidisoma sp. S159]|uniref:Holliday junction resolvase RuvX n=1 Tax=Acidisoma sp. S159 TaxID=1747225 RepID=UPI00131ACD0C|nr:Holliday junction resolvase RuvX [Acidisoma sp. S159]
MPIINLTDLVTNLSAEERLIGLDPGSKNIGVALSDVRRRVASPYGTLPRNKIKAIAFQITKLAEREQAGGLVVGMPLEEDGRMGPRAQAARDWAWALSEEVGLPAAMWDETLTTADVHEMLIGEADLGRRRRAQVIDRLAAARILQGALDSLGDAQQPLA